MPSGDEGTGLHAFDDLDPISTVSALNVAAGGGSAGPPRALGTAAAAAAHRSDVRCWLAGLPAAAGSQQPGRARRRRRRAVARGALGAASAARAPEHASRAWCSSPSPRQEATRTPRSCRTPSRRTRSSRPRPPSAQSSPTCGVTDRSRVRGRNAESSGVDGDVAPSAAKGRGIDDTELLELSATTVATNIDMDWDEEEVQTQLRDERTARGGARRLAQHGRGPSAAGGRSFAVPGADRLALSGQSFAVWRPPSFAAPGGATATTGRATTTRRRAWSAARRSASAPAHRRLAAASASRPSDSLTPASNTVATYAGDDFESGAARPPQAGVDRPGSRRAARRRLRRAHADRRRRAGDDDARHQAGRRRGADRRQAAGRSEPARSWRRSSSPASSTTLVVRKAGFAEQTQQFAVEAGEVKPLPRRRAHAAARRHRLRAHLGAGRRRDLRRRQASSTRPRPPRITDLEPGLHVIRLDSGDGYQPLGDPGRARERPGDRAARRRSWSPEQAARVAQAADAASASERSRQPLERAAVTQLAAARSSRERRELARPRAAMRAARAAPRPAPISTCRPPRCAGHGGRAAAPAGGNQGTLRINSRPWSQVYVDGRLIGNTPQMNIPLSLGLAQGQAGQPAARHDQEPQGRDPAPARSRPRSSR